MNWFIFAIASLAVFRLAEMFSSEEGPLSAFSILRRKVPPKTNPGRGIRCSRCLSVWFGALITAYLWRIGQVPELLTPVFAFALSGASILLHRLHEPPSQ